MPRPRRIDGPLATLLTALLLTAALAGCIGDEDSDGRFASYEDAKAAVVQTYEPADSTSPVRLGLISPEDPSRIGTGGLDVVVLLYDSEADEPITDAEFKIEAFMPQMGHGTDPETNPTHDAHGVYVGSTTITMGGTWMINLDPTLPDGTTLAFDVEVHASDEDGMDGGMHGGMGNTTYGSYQEAKDASGETFAPNQTDSPVQLKLLEPATTTGIEAGKLNLTLLLFDSQADEPVTNATMTLDARMPAMGHGTSPEIDPAHEAHGVYQGLTNLVMNGTWVLDLTADPGDGTNLTWSIEVQVGDGGMMMAEPPEGYNQSHEDTVSEQSYEQNWTFEIEWVPARANLTLALSGTPLTSVTDELTLTVFDPNGTEVGSISVSGGSNGTLELDDFEAEGNHTAQVTGQGVEAEYTLEIEVAYLPKAGHDHGSHQHG